MNIIAFFIVLFFMLGIIVLTIILLFKLKKSSASEIPPNSPIIIKLSSKDSSGHCLFVLGSEESKYSNRIYVTAKALDVPYNSNGKPKEVGLKDFIINDEKRIILPVGSISEHRNLWFILPDSVSELDPRFRNTHLGVAISKMTETVQIIDKGFELVKESRLHEKQVIDLLLREENKLLDLYKKEINQRGQPILNKENTQ